MNSGDKKTILLAEDEVIIAMMEKMRLEKYGYIVHHVTSGEEAVKTILEEHFPIDLILMDINLGPGIDGTQAAEQILNHKDIPVVFLSSHTEPEVVEKTEKITSYGYVVKNSGIVVLDTSMKMAFKLFEANKKLSNELAERKRAEEKIQEMDVRMRKLFANVTDLIYQFTRRPDGSYYVPIASKGVRNIFGCSPEDVRDNFEPISRVIYPEDAARVIEDIEYSAKHLTYFTCEFRVQIPGRDIQWILSRSTPEKLPDGSITWYGFNVDITERKQLEKQRQAEEDNLRITLNSIGDAVISTDNQGRIVRMNPVAEMLCGWKEAEAYGKKLEEVFYIANAGTREGVDTPVESVMRTGTVGGLANHTLLLSKDGKEYQIADSAAPITTTEGDITGVVLVFRDITDQYEKDRQLEERLKELNCLYKIAEIVEKPDIVLKDIFQKTAEVIPQSWQYPEICEAGITLHGQTFQTNNFALTKWCLNSDLIVNGIVSGEVTICYREEKPSRDEGPFLKDERKLLDAVAERLGRITERKQLEENLHSIEWMLSGKKDKKKRHMPEYGDLTELNKNGLILSSLGKDQLMQISSEYLDLLETSSAVYEKNGDYALGLFSSGWCQLLDAASRKLCRTEDNKEALSCGKWLCHESCWRDASIKSIEGGRPVDVECAGGIHLYAIPVRANGEVIGVINFGYGNPPVDDIQLQKLSELYQIPIEVLRKKREEYQTRPQFIVDYAKKRIENSARLIGNLVEQKRAEEKLQRSEKDLTASQRIAHVGSWRLDVATNHVVWTEELYNMYGFDPSVPPPPYTEHMKLFTPESWERLSTALANTRETGIPYTLELETIRKDGTNGWMWVQGEAEVDSAGKTVQIWGAAQDITERERTKQELSSQKQYLEAILETTSDGFWVVTPDKKIMNINHAYCQMSGYSTDELASMEINDLDAIENPQVTAKRIERIIKNGSETFETKHRRKDGSLLDVEVSASRLDRSDGMCLVCFCRDITERKQAQEEIKKQLSEKETLLLEVHHRVKNNIATIESLLSLQTDSTKNPEVKSALQDTISRVQGIRVLYEKLLLSKDYQDVSIKMYTESMIDSLLSVFVSDKDITIEKHISDFIITSKTAISIGIIITELLTNVFKYAFKERDSGIVTVSIEKAENTATLIIQDNGVGIDERIVANKSPGFGMTIVNMLVRQLNGNYRVVNENGTKSVLQFEI